MVSRLGIFCTVFLMIVFALACLVCAQTRSVHTPCEQVLITPSYKFVRYGESGQTYGQWFQHFKESPQDAKRGTFTFKTNEWPKKVDQNLVKHELERVHITNGEHVITGEEVWKWFSTRNKVTVSGHFNLSGDKSYDRTDFGGEHFP